MISVVIPVYNAGEYVIEAVKSAIDQDVEKELIVIDDCSTDGCVDRLTEYLDSLNGEIQRTQDAAGYTYDDVVSLPIYVRTLTDVRGIFGDVKIRVYRNKENAGVAVSRNIGVQLSEGEYIAYLDADDVWKENKLICQLRAIETSGSCLCNTARRLMTFDGVRTDKIIHTPVRITLDMLRHTNYINCSSVLIKKEVAVKYPMEHDRDSHEDYLTWLRILSDFDYVIGIDEAYLLYRLSPEGKSRNKLKSAGMTYRTYCYAGYGRIRAGLMLFSYAVNGLLRRI